MSRAGYARLFRFAKATKRRPDRVNTSFNRSVAFGRWLDFGTFPKSSKFSRKKSNIFEKSLEPIQSPSILLVQVQIPLI